MATCLIHKTGISFKATINVTASPGASVTISLDNVDVETKTASNAGSASFIVKKKGTYTVTSGSQSATVSITTRKQVGTANVTGAYKLTISTSHASISVSRSESPYGPSGTSTGALANNATIYYGDKLTASATASSGFKNATVSTSGSVTKSGDYYIVGGNCTLTGSAEPVSVKLTLTSREIVSGTTAATASLNRTSSPYANAGTGNVTAGNDMLYYGDTFTVASTSAVAAAYTAGTPTVSGAGSPNASGVYTVGTSNVTVTAAATTKSVTLTLKSYPINKLTAANASIDRKSSPYQGAATGSVADGGKLYYGDTFTAASTAAGTPYTASTPTVSGAGNADANGRYTVSSSNVTVTAAASVKSYTLTLTAGANVTTTVSWSSSTYAGKSGQVISKKNASNQTATIYYGDKLTITDVADTNYTASHTVNSGNIDSVTGNVTITSTSSAAKLTIKIYNRNDHIFTFDVYPGNVTWRSQIVASGSYAGMTYAWHPNWSWTSYELTSSKYMEKVYFYCGGNINNNDVLPVRFNFRYYYVNSDYDVEGNGILYKDQARTQQLNDNETIAGGTYYGALT